MTANLRQLRGAGLVEEDAISAALDRITLADTEADAVAGATFVTEAVAEDLVVKQELFERVESLVQSRSAPVVPPSPVVTLATLGTMKPAIRMSTIIMSAGPCSSR